MIDPIVPGLSHNLKNVEHQLLQVMLNQTRRETRTLNHEYRKIATITIQGKDICALVDSGNASQICISQECVDFLELGSKVIPSIRSLGTATQEHHLVTQGILPLQFTFSQAQPPLPEYRVWATVSKELRAPINLSGLFLTQVGAIHQFEHGNLIINASTIPLLTITRKA